MKIEFKPNQYYATYSGWTYTWFLKISTKKEELWLVSYEVMSLLVGIIILLTSTLIVFIAICHKEILEKLWDIMWHLRVVFIFTYIVFLFGSIVELLQYFDCDDYRECKKIGKLEAVIMVAVRMIRGLPIIILGLGIIYGLFYFISLLII